MSETDCLAAIDAEHRNKVRQAKAEYDQVMGPARAAFLALQHRADKRQKAALAAAYAWKTKAYRAVSPAAAGDMPRLGAARSQAARLARIKSLSQANQGERV